jgi:hypothetical protein
VVQGIGWALNEEYIYDASGRMENPGFRTACVSIARRKTRGGRARALIDTTIRDRAPLCVVMSARAAQLLREIRRLYDSRIVAARASPNQPPSYERRAPTGWWFGSVRVAAEVPAGRWRYAPVSCGGTEVTFFFGILGKKSAIMLK